MQIYIQIKRREEIISVRIRIAQLGNTWNLKILVTISQDLCAVTERFDSKENLDESSPCRISVSERKTRGGHGDSRSIEIPVSQWNLRVGIINNN